MNAHRRNHRRAGFVALIALVTTAGASHAMPAAQPQPDSIVVAQAQGTRPGELQPRYQPVQGEPDSWYNASYIFGMTRSVARSSMVPGAKAPLFLLTVPCDIVLLPFAAIGGLFG